MMKLTYQTMDGMKFSDEFQSSNEFIQIQSQDQALIADHCKVIYLEIDGQEVEFKGNIAELYFKLLVI